MTQVFILQGTTTWSVPSDWNPANNTIECFGAGGGGQTASGTNAGSGGGGGGYSKVTNLAGLSGTITVQVGAGGTAGNAGTDTWFNGASLAASSVGAKAGLAGSNGTGGLGGERPSNTGGVGTTKNLGGTGGATTTAANGASGGGGAAGPNGNGSAGGSASGFNGGAGGGGNGGGSTTAGVAPTGNNGANGGVAQDGTAGGLGATTTGASGAGGSHGSGGGGGAVNTPPAQDGSGGAGGAGIDIDASHGGGGGGGGGAGNGGGAFTEQAGNGGAGGNYGGGGGGSGFAASNGAGGTGGNGLIVITYTPAVLVAAALDEARRVARRVAWRERPEARAEEFLSNPTQAVFKPWGFEEESLVRRVPRRSPWRAHPPQPADNEGLPFTAVKTPANWPDIDEPGKRRLRPWHAHPQPDDNEGLPFTAATPTAWSDIDGPPKLRRRSPWRASLTPLEDTWIGLVQLVPSLPWGFEEEPQHAVPRRRVWHAGSEPLREEFLFNQTQIVYAAWGFEEEQHRQERRIFHRLVQQEDPLGLPQLVPALPWGFEEEPQHQVIRRPTRRAFSQPLSDEFLNNPTQAVFVGWSFEEEPLIRRVPRRTVWRARPQPADNEGLPFALAVTVYVEWGGDIAFRQQRRIFRRLIQQDDPLGAVQLVGVPWAFEEEPNRQVSRRPIRRPYSQLLSDEFLNNPTQVVFAEWGDELAHRQRRGLWRSHVPPEELIRIPLPAVLTPANWGDIEENLKQRRRTVWHARPQPDDVSGFPFLVIPITPAPFLILPAYPMRGPLSRPERLNSVLSPGVSGAYVVQAPLTRTKKQT